MNALRRIHLSLARGGLLLDLQPTLVNAPVVSADGVLGRLDEREFRRYAARVNAALEETVVAGLFAHEGEVLLDVVHRFGDAAELLAEVETWTGTRGSGEAREAHRTGAPAVRGARGRTPPTAAGLSTLSLQRDVPRGGIPLETGGTGPMARRDVCVIGVGIGQGRRDTR